MADKAAEQANKTIPNCTINNTSLYDIFNYIYNKVILLWQQSKDSISPTNKLKSVTDSVKQWYAPPKLSRRQDIVIAHAKNWTHLSNPLLSHHQRPTTNLQYLPQYDSHTTYKT